MFTYRYFYGNKFCTDKVAALDETNFEITGHHIVEEAMDEIKD